MRHVAIAAAIAAFVLAAVANGGTTQPSLRYLKHNTTHVYGVHFKPGEHVGVTLRSGTTKLVRTVRTTGAGKFTVAFGALANIRCTGTISLLAIGAKGDRASFTISTTAGCTSSGGVSPATTTPATTTTTTPGLAPPPPYVT
ncbi:MAG TPA: hypothetical protein VGM80_00110 [Gaiellaceae bacterium]|jgi:hypothetical protein